ncbi:sialate O-acetylesterase [Parafilimonas sp.]|uniref:sialate O-acetylesterase n=1 Tax=Parafilimonas sp. TaxID=1969739 RepID=UPI0039E4BC40
MKYLIIVCFMIVVNVLQAQQSLFLVAGQSNAVGMADSSASVTTTASEYCYTTNSLKPLKDPVGCNELHFQKASTGSAWPAFADAYAKQTGDKVVIAQAARGGSSCSYKAELDDYGTWDTTGRLPLFDSAIIKTKAAIRKTGIPLKGIIWSQGERDANAINTGQLTAAVYKSTLENLILRFRKKLGHDTPFYIIQTGYYKDHDKKGFDEVRTCQRDVAAQVKNVMLVYDETGSFIQKGLMKDQIHYNQQALNMIGKTVAERIVSAEKK